MTKKQRMSTELKTFLWVACIAVGLIVPILGGFIGFNYWEHTTKNGFMYSLNKNWKKTVSIDAELLCYRSEYDVGFAEGNEFAVFLYDENELEKLASFWKDKDKKFEDNMSRRIHNIPSEYLPNWDNDYYYLEEKKGKSELFMFYLADTQYLYIVFAR